MKLQKKWFEYSDELVNFVNTKLQHTSQVVSICIGHNHNSHEDYCILFYWDKPPVK